jgi:biotin carboxyl carrier protein
MTLTYQEVSRILSILDAAPEKDLDLNIDGLHIVVTSWSQHTHIASSSLDQNQIATVTAEKSTALLPLFHEVSAKYLGYFHANPSSHVGSQVRNQEPIGTISVLGHAAVVVKAPQDGWISDICVNDGDFVEYGQTLAMMTTNRIDAGNGAVKKPF